MPGKTTILRTERLGVPFFGRSFPDGSCQDELADLFVQASAYVYIGLIDTQKPPAYLDPAFSLKLVFSGKPKIFSFHRST